MQFESITFDLPAPWKKALKAEATERKYQTGSCTVSDLVREAVSEKYGEKIRTIVNGDTSAGQEHEESERKSA